jgi:hypothetical protein
MKNFITTTKENLSFHMIQLDMATEFCTFSICAFFSILQIKISLKVHEHSPAQLFKRVSCAFFAYGASGAI